MFEVDRMKPDEVPEVAQIYEDGWKVAYRGIMSIYVRPECVGKGYGKALLRHAMTELRGRGFDRIYIWTLEKNRNARAFYEREGFSYNSDLIEIELGGAKLIEFRYERDFRAEGETRGQSSDLNRE